MSESTWVIIGMGVLTGIGSLTAWLVKIKIARMDADTTANAATIQRTAELLNAIQRDIVPRSEVDVLRRDVFDAINRHSEVTRQALDDMRRHEIKELHEIIRHENHQMRNDLNNSMELIRGELAQLRLQRVTA